MGGQGRDSAPRQPFPTNCPSVTLAEKTPLQALDLSPDQQFTTMDRLLRFLNCLLLLVVIPLASALKFDIHAVQQSEAAKHERCIRNFVARDQLVVVTAIVSGNRGDGQIMNMHVCCASNLRWEAMNCGVLVANDSVFLDPRCDGQRLWQAKGCRR